MGDHLHTKLVVTDTKKELVYDHLLLSVVVHKWPRYVGQMLKGLHTKLVVTDTKKELVYDHLLLSVVVHKWPRYVGQMLKGLYIRVDVLHLTSTARPELSPSRR